jgi:hypothetical protein
MTSTEFFSSLGVAVTAGLISAAITTCIIFLVRLIWIERIKPWLDERVYQDAEVAGKWEITYPDEPKSKEHIVMKRMAHAVKGEIIVFEGEDQGRRYQFDGVLKNRILTASYSNQDRHGFDSGTFTLLVVSNGDRMEGHTAYYEDESNEIAADRCVWTRLT